MSSIIPDSVEPIIAWRGWTISKDGYLESPFRPGSIWTPGEASVANCPSGRCSQGVINDGCSCGIYGMRTLEELDKYALVWLLHSMTGTLVIGQVSLWGTVVEGRGGFRAQFAYPKHLIVADQRNLATDRRAILRLRSYPGTERPEIVDRLPLSCMPAVPSAGAYLSAISRETAAYYRDAFSSRLQGWKELQALCRGR